jgi:hypothetical protein
MNATIRCTLTIGVFLAGTVSPAWPQEQPDYTVGEAAYERGDYSLAFKELLPLARKGTAEAQFYMGVMYEKGLGVPQDYAEAIRWSRKAAERGVKEAQYNVGLIYFRGLGIAPDYVQAHFWWNLSAARGYKAASESRNAIATDMTLNEVTQAHKLAREWRPKNSRSLAVPVSGITPSETPQAFSSGGIPNGYGYGASQPSPSVDTRVRIRRSNDPKSP